MIFGRPLLIALTYLSASLAPPGAQSSLMGLFTFPVKFLPYVMIGMDLLMGGAAAAGHSVAGALVGHFWWWGVFASRQNGAPGVLEQMGTAPRWLSQLLDGDGPRGGDDGAAGGAGGGGGGGGRRPRENAPVYAGGGVQVIPPRRTLASTNAPSSGGSSSSGYNWGSGQRLGTE